MGMVWSWPKIGNDRRKRQVSLKGRSVDGPTRHPCRSDIDENPYPPLLGTHMVQLAASPFLTGRDGGSNPPMRFPRV